MNMESVVCGIIGGLVVLGIELAVYEMAHCLRRRHKQLEPPPKYLPWSWVGCGEHAPPLNPAWVAYVKEADRGSRVEKGERG
jgi:hypothetical protein